MKNTSIWQLTAGYTDVQFPVYEGNRRADAVVIGGGITGLTAALLLAEAGKKVVVLEARRIGEGTTGNSTGNLYVSVDEHLSSIKKKWGRDVMMDVIRSRKKALDFILHNAARFNIDCALRDATFNLFMEEDEKNAAKILDDEAAAWKDAGLEFTDSRDVTVPFAARRMLSMRGQAQFHPLNYARGLAKAIQTVCNIYENSPAINIDHSNGVVHTPAGTIEADHIVMATHTPKGVWMVQTVLGPYREHGVACDLAEGSLPDGIFWSVNKPKHSVRSVTANGKTYAVVVGDKYKTGHGEDTTAYVRRLDHYLQTRFKLGTDSCTWGGQQYSPADGLPYIGKHSDKLWFLTGFSTDGLVYGTLGAMIVSDLITGGKNEWEKTYALKRFTPAKSFREFFVENADNFAQYLKDNPWHVDAHRLSEVAPGDGKVMEIEGEKVAVHRDEHGALHAVSAVCPHMKCIVHWNTSEKSWDCPCHGSRFDTEGRVIEGPAVTGLQQKGVQVREAK